MTGPALGPKQVRLAVAPIAWINDDIAELSAVYTLEECLQESSEAGYVGTEAGRSFPEDPAVLLAKLEGAGLVMASGWWSGMLRTGTVEDEIERIDSYLNMFSGCGTEIMFYGEIDGSIQAEDIPLSERPTMSEAEFKKYGKRLMELAKHTKSRGVGLCFHHHMGTVVQSAEDVEMLMRHTGSDLGLLVDTGHMVFAGDDPNAVARKHASRLAYVHLKDLRKDPFDHCVDEDWPFVRAIREDVFTVPGDGFIDFDGFIKSLSTIKYSGWLVVEAEQDPRTRKPLKYAIMGREHIEPLLDKHAFVVYDEQDLG